MSHRIVAHSLVMLALAGVVAAGCNAATAAGPGVAKEGCVDPAQSLGVSRVVEIDTTAGPRFGHQQYQENDFLAEGEIVLTFDDGPLRPYTRPILDALDAQCTKATFFMVGRMAQADPEMVKEVFRRGHTIGSHTYSHANLRKSTPLNARREIEIGFSAVQAALGRPLVPFFRFPFLADTKAMKSYAETRGLGVFSIDADAYDYKTKDPAFVHQSILSQIGESRKGIILFHDIQPATAHALPGLLAALKAKGYKVVQLKAKGTLQTLPEFDAIARNEQALKQMVAASEPLATRAVTWPVAAPKGSTASLDPTVPSNQPRAVRAPRTTVAVAAPGAGGSLPQGAGVPYYPPVAPPPSTLAAPGRVPRARPEPDWRDAIFRGN